MNLHQFRFVQEAVRRDLNLTETAKALFTSQPGVSKAILELEGELGVDIFARHGKRLRRVTEPGREVLKAIEVIMREVGNLKRIGDEFSKQDAGTLSIATTHSQARYFLPMPIAAMRKRYPKVNISLHQGTPEQVAKMVYEEVADFGLATESLGDIADLVTLPCYAWQHVLPLISDHPSFSGRKRIDQAFAVRKLQPNFVLEAIDADVIKTYVRLGLGVGIVAEIAMREEGQTADLVARPVGHLFGQNVARIAFKRGAYLRNFVYAFAEMTSERLTRPLIERAMSGDADDYQL